MSLLRALAVAGALVAVLAGPAARAETPTEAVREATEKILAILKGPDYAGEDKGPARRKAIRAVVDERFDWATMSRRSLGRYWRDITEDQQREFVAVFSELLEATYMGRVEGYSGEKVAYGRESREGDEAQVDVTITAEKEGDISVVYRLHMPDANWLVRDVSVEGVSLVQNYRKQFYEMLARSSFDKVLEQLRKKVEEQRK